MTSSDTSPNLHRRSSNSEVTTTTTLENSAQTINSDNNTTRETHIDMGDIEASPTNNQNEQNNNNADRRSPIASLRNLSGQTRNLFNLYMEHAYNRNNASTPNSNEQNNTDNTERNEESLEEFTWRIVTRPPPPAILAVMILLCLALTFVKEMALHLGLFLSVVVAFTHYHDDLKFTMIQRNETTSSFFPLVFSIFLRSFVVAVLVGIRNILHVAALMLVSGGEDSFVITIGRVILAEILIQDFVLLLRIMFYPLPVGPSTKRRINVFFENTSYTYRTLVPFVQWAAYFSPPFLFTIYLIFKVYFFITRVITWFKLGKVLWIKVNIGETVDPNNLDPGTTCSICQSNFSLPRQMKCSHVFCTNCITTWAETSKGNTCPLCRSHILPPKSNKFSDFDEKYPLVIF